MGEILETGVIDGGNINGTKVSCNELCYTELEAFQEDRFYLEDDGEVIFKGSDEQIAEMFADYANYFGEVTNPWNTMTNAFLKNKYAPLNEVLNTVRPVLAENGFSVIQTPKVDEKGDVLVQTILMHRSGAMISFPSLKSKAVKADIQGLGAAITYLRRFAISSILGVASENDDDGNGNSTKDKTKKPPVKDPLTPEQAEARKVLIQLCSELSAKAPENKKTIVDALKAIEPTGNINKLRSDEEFTKATEIVNGLGL